MDKKKLQQKLVRITLTDADRLRIGKDLSEAIGRKRNTEMEFDDVKASYKAKLTAVEADVDRLSTTLSVGFEMRLENLWIRFLPKTGKKEFRLERQTEKDEPVLIEDMGPDDYALELIEAEEPFVHRFAFVLLESERANVSVTIASVDRIKWVSALRGKHGPHKLDERLDTEQRSFPAPGSALDAALKRLTASIGDHYDAAKAEKLNAELKERLADIRSKLPPVPEKKK